MAIDWREFVGGNAFGEQVLERGENHLLPQIHDVLVGFEGLGVFHALLVVEPEG